MKRELELRELELMVKALARALRPMLDRLAQQNADLEVQVAQLRDRLDELLETRTAPSPAPEDDDAASSLHH